MIFFPFFGALLQAFLPDRGKIRVARTMAFGASLISGFLGLVLVANMHAQMPELQFNEILPWIGSYAITYDLGVDGLNATVLLLISILFPLVMASEWSQKHGARGMGALFLLLQGSFVGAVCAQDLFLQFFFWAFTGIPIYFLVGIWGGEGKERASFRAIVTSSIGNVLLFAAMILIYYSVDPHTFSLRELAGGKLAGRFFEIFGASVPVSGLASILISLGLALRAPIWPFHGWFTEVAEEAPASVFVVVSSVTLSVASYIFIRLSYTLFPEILVSVAPAIVTVGLINLIVGGICAVAQTDLKLLIAFASLSQVGLVLIGAGSLSPAGVVGAVYLQLCFGLAIAGFGLFSGLISKRIGSSKFLGKDHEKLFSGLANPAPAIAVFAGLMMASLLGFPAMGGFVGAALVIIGSYSMHPVVVLLSGAAMLLTTYYLLTMYKNVFFGKTSGGFQDFTDLNLTEKAYLLPIVGTLLILGLYPRPFLELVRPTVLTLLSSIK